MLKRLTSASTASWAQNFQYDGFGNLTGKTLNGASTATLNVDPATNRLTQASYDGNGNMMSGAGAGFTYDEANRATSATVTSGGTEYYGYAPDNKRIYRLKTDGQTEEFTFYGAQGERLGVYQQLGLNGTPYFQPLRKTVWFAGRKIWEDQASGTGAGQVYENRLKSNRNSGGYYPYGEEISGTTNDRTKFGSYNRDSFTGFDYADQRYYASTYGRFNRPDPLAHAAIGVPQTWNQYAYAENDPVNNSDPTGLDPDNPSTWETIPNAPYFCWDSGDEDGPPNVTCFGNNGPTTIQTQGKSTAKKLVVTNYSRAGAKESAIANVLQKLLDQVLSQDDSCSKWLATGQFSGADFVNAILAGGPGNYTFGYGQLSQNSIAAFVGNQNGDGTPVQGLPVDASITVNSNGAFFNSMYTVGPGVLTGGTLQAQAFILLHEIGHEVGLLGPDAGNPQAGNANDNAVNANCGKQIAAIK